MINSLFVDKVNILRRTATPSIDALNNPTFGSPETWPIVYTGINIRLAFSSKGMKISSTGELIYPTGTLYFDKKYTLQPMDRIIIVSSQSSPVGTEYVIEAVYPSYLLTNVVDHMEGNVHLPIA